MNDPTDLERVLIEADRDECCSRLTRKPCQTIAPPPDLYQTIIDRRSIPQNSCPIRNSRAVKTLPEDSYQWKEILKKMRLSLKVLYNTFKISFDIQSDN